MSMAHKLFNFARSTSRRVGAALAAAVLVLAAAPAAATNTGVAGDDMVSGSFPIGFDFSYYGRSISTFTVSTNGLLQFGTSSNGGGPDCSAGGLDDSVYMFWADQRTDVNGQPPGKVLYQVFGSAPDRRLVVEWVNSYFYRGNLPVGTFEAVLYEGTNQIKLQYRNLDSPLSNGSAARIGISGRAANGEVSTVGCNSGTALLHAQQAITFTPGADAATYVVDTAAAYAFDDVPDLSLSAPQTNAYTLAAPVWTWTQASGITQYQIEIQSANGTVVKTETLGNVASYTWATGYVENVSYMARIRGSVDGTTWGDWSDMSRTTTVNRTPPSIVITSVAQSSGEGGSGVMVSTQVQDSTDGSTVEFQYATDAAFSQIVFDETQNGMFDIWNGAVDGQHLYIRAQAKDQAGNVSAWSATFEYVVHSPLAITAVKNFVQNTPAWAWGAPPRLTAYQIEIQDLSGTVVKTENLGAVATYAWADGYTVGSTYRARLRGSPDGGTTWEDWSPISDTVIVDQTPPTAIMQGVTQGGTPVTSLTINTAAQDNFSNTFTYQLQIASDSDFSNVVFDQTQNQNGNFVWTAGNGGQHVYIRMRATDAAGNQSAWSVTVESTIQPPLVASFTPSVTSGPAPLTVTFTNTSNVQSGASFSWNFGDGIGASGTSTSHVFANAGTYTVTLQGTALNSSSASTTITVLTGAAQPDAPTVVPSIRTNPTWAWNTSPASNLYQIEIQDSTGAVVATQNLALGSYTWTTGYTNGQSYQAHVRGSLDNGTTWGPWSAMSRLVLIDPNAPLAADTGAVGDDNVQGPFPIGFSFQYFGQQVTRFWASTNGLLQFANASNAYSNGCLPTYDNTIYVFWDDLRTDVAGQPNGKIQYRTVGEAPNRRLIVQWTNQYFYGSGLPMGTFQAVLYEGTSQVRLQYRYLTGADTGSQASGSSATVGIQGLGQSTQFDQFTCNSGAALHQEQAILFTPSGATSYTMDGNAPYGFEDISGLTPTIAPVVAYTKTAPVFNWAQIPDLNTYQIEVQNAAGEVIKTETLANVGTYTFADFVAGQTYRARLRGSVNAGATWEIWSELSGPVVVDQDPPTVQISAFHSVGGTATVAIAEGDALSPIATTHTQFASDALFGTIVYDNTVVGLLSSAGWAGVTPGAHLYARVIATDAAGNTTTSNMLDFVAPPPARPAFTATPLTGEAPLLVTLTNTSTDTENYLWSFGNSTPSSSAANPAPARYAQPGTYTITLAGSNLAWGNGTPATQTVVVTPDVTPPSFNPPFTQMNGLPAGASLTVSQYAELSFGVFDGSGVTTPVGKLDGQPITLYLNSTNVDGTAYYHLVLDPAVYANGNHTLSVSVADTVGNIANLSIQIIINLPPPNAPTITSPVAGYRTNHAALTVTGSTDNGTEAQLIVNGVAQTTWVPVTGQSFSIPLTLIEGANRIAAVARNSRGSSAASAEIVATLDTSRPVGPTGLSGSSLVQGRVHLGWNPATDAKSVGTVVLRSTAAFSDPAAAVQIAGPLATNAYDDLPSADGTYFYSVASINALGTYSQLSNAVQLVADSIPPTAVAITYAPQGRVNASTGGAGQGLVNVNLRVSEALQAVPYLAMVPQGGSPLAVNLTRVDDTHYTGSFTIDSTVPSGQGTALFSARDMVGNRGTDVTAGANFLIETDGPSLTGIGLAPGAPIRNDTAQTITATFTFSKAPQASPAPVIRYTLSGPLRQPVTLTGMVATNATTWTGSFTLPSDAGNGSPETLTFTSSATDALGNISTSISAPNRFQVYQGNLPPLDVPLGLTGKAQPGGKIALAWLAVGGASQYQIYRQAPGEALLTALTRTTGVSYVDSTSADGHYRYAVTAIRQNNGQESESGQSAAVDVSASANAPGAPQNLSLALSGQGIVATWQAPLASTVDSYNLYRSTGTSISSINGLTPIKTGIRQLGAIDTNPSPLQGAYVVTALDAAGNESAISNSAYLNASLLPVTNLHALQSGTDLPLLSWNAPNGNVAGYLVYVGPVGSQIKLTANPITALSYIDSGFTSGERKYTVSAVDANGVEMPHSLTLPAVTTQVVSGLPILRGVMNQLQVQVSNAATSAVTNARVVVHVPVDATGTQFSDFKSQPFNLTANQTQLIPVVVGGYPALTAPLNVLVGVESVPNDGELVTLNKPQTFDVGNGALVVGMTTDAFTRGATGTVKLTVENTSAVDIELLTARHSGADASDEMRLRLLDADGNVLSTQAYFQALGANVITLPDGETVARIPAGASYVSDPFTLNVPAASPNSLTVKLEVDKIRYHSGQDDQIAIAGTGSTKTVTLSDTAYFGVANDVSPVSSFGDQNVIITGQAQDRASSSLVPNARLKIVLNQQGFERVINVVTDNTGHFSYTFVPTITDTGLFKVSVLHPDMTDRPEQKAFSINRVSVGPTPYALNVPKNYPFTVPFVATAGAGTSATNVRLALNAGSQATGQLPVGIKAQLPAGVTLTERQSLNLPVLFSADSTAQPSGSLIFDLLSDEHGAAPIGQATVNYTLSEALPFLVSTPNVIETGLARGNSTVETVQVKNNGLQDALNLVFTLTNVDGTPAAGWASISSNANGTMAIGAQRNVDLAFAPPSGQADGVYSFKLNVTGDNVPKQSMDVVVSVTESGQGNVLFKASDIYTATVGKDGHVIQGLASATITLQNEDVTSITLQVATDAVGEALFQNVPAGNYSWRASAGSHQDVSGRLRIKPGVTLNQPVFLDYTLVTVEWNVTEVTIQDRYDVTLNATFETDVPAAVVMLTPLSTNLPKMNAGDVYYGELTLQNYGLVRADNVTQSLPQSDAFFRYEFLVTVPDSLQAKQRITIPYRVIALKSLDDQVGNASGGGCYTYSNQLALNYNYRCSNGNTTNGSANTNWFSSNTSTCPAGGGSTGGGGGGGGWGGGGFGGASNGGNSLKIKGGHCVFIPNGKGGGCAQ